MSDQQSFNDHSSDEEEKTQPRKRLRRLLAGSEENEVRMNAFAESAQPLNPEEGDPAARQDAPEQAQAQQGAVDAEELSESPAEQAAHYITAPPDQERTAPRRARPLPQPGAPDKSEPPADQAATRVSPARPADEALTRPYQPGSEVEQTRPSLSGQTPRPTRRPTVPPPGEEATLPPAQVTPPDGFQSIPLPRRVEEVDPNATQVTPAAYQDYNMPPAGGYPSSPPYQPQRPTYVNRQQARQQAAGAGGRRGVPPGGGSRPAAGASAARRPASRRPVRPGARGWRRNLGCALRFLVALLFLVVFLIVAAGSWVVFQYFTIASELPNVSELRQRASQFETTRILDRNGDLLYEIIDPNAGRRTYTSLGKISPYVVAATIATEDKVFYSHPGFDPIAIARAFWWNYTTGEIVSGASTITQQISRALLLTPEERNQQTYERKAREIVLASEITRRYSKDEILELYLNEINYGNLAYGIEAGAETYFHTTADKLTLGQSAFLAGLPQSPSVYDIYTNREETLRRQKQVVLLMYQLSQEEGCIYVSNSPDKVCVDAAAATKAVQEIDSYSFQMEQNNMRYPHWVTFIRSILEAQYDPQTIYRSGFTVYTTLDPALQDQAQQIITQQVANLADHNAKNGALVSVRPSTGEILAMVGSPDFYNEAISGQINMAIVPRQPGSSIKPMTYVAAFEKGWTPSTLIWDVPTNFPPSGNPSDPRPPYQPVNYDGRFHGPVTVRTALSNSFNIPAVKALQFVGIYDDPNIPGEDGLIAFLRRMGIDTLTRDDYGLSLTLGGGETSLLQLTSAYSVLANGGRRMPPVAITRIEDYAGNVVYEYKPSQGEQVVRPEHAYLMSSILSDNEARTPMFGANSVLNLPFQVAAKTGTTNDFRDNLTFGYTPDLATGVWIGNADYTEMQNVTGLTGAAPAWAGFMQYAVPYLTNGNPTPFTRPGSVVERVICAISGTEPSEFCPQQRAEEFAADQPPLPKEDDLWKKINIDTWTGLKASSECSEFSKEAFTLNVQDPWAVTWIKDTDQGRAWADSMGFRSPILFVPQRECNINDPRPEIHFAGVSEGQTITQSPLDVYAVVRASANFRQFRLEWGQGDNPADWQPLVENIANQYDKPERIYSWDVSQIPAGTVTLRIYLESTENDRYAEKRIHLNLQVPTPTPTATPTETSTPTPTQTPTMTQTPTHTLTPLPTNTPTITPTLPPTETPTRTPKPPKPPTETVTPTPVTS